MDNRTQVRLTVNLTDWQCEALFDAIDRHRDPCDDRHDVAPVAEYLHNTVCEYVEALTERFKNIRMGVYKERHYAIGDPTELDPKCIAAWWADQSPGRREEFMERIGATRHDFDGGYDVYPMATTPPG